MTWTELSDDCWTLSDAAFRLHTEGLIRSNRKLLDLRIPKSELRRFAKTPESVAELLSAGWWDEDDSAYVIRHHATYQRMREAVVKQQEVNKANRAKRGEGTPSGREQDGTSPNESLNESLDSSSDERSRTRQDREAHNEASSNESESDEMDSLNPQTGELERRADSSGPSSTYRAPQPILPPVQLSSETQDTCRVCGRPLGWAMARQFAICALIDKKHEAAKEVA